jgi:hypothetical protein
MSGFFGMLRREGRPPGERFLQRVAAGLEFRGPEGTQTWRQCDWKKDPRSRLRNRQGARVRPGYGELSWACARPGEGTLAAKKYPARRRASRALGRGAASDICPLRNMRFLLLQGRWKFNGNGQLAFVA